MNYVSQYLWEKGAADQVNPVSVVLQQAKIRGKSVLLACVCEGGSEGEDSVTESGYFTERLIEWFYHVFLKKYMKKDAEEEAEAALYAEFEKIYRELADYGRKRGFEPKLNYWGILLKENSFWMFSKGNCQGYLLNKRFNRRQIRSLNTTEQMSFLSGKVQKNLGIFLCNISFTAHFEKEELLEVLFGEKELTEEKAEKHLKELWQENISRGGSKSTGAVYIRTC